VIDDGLRAAAEVAGDRWVLLTLAALGEGPRRFGDLLADIAGPGGAADAADDGAPRGIAPNVLIDRLRRMERAGLVTATPYTHRPRRHVYDLTASGRELGAVLLPALAVWGAHRRGGEPVRHEVCGTPLEPRWWCPTCATAVDAEPADGAVWL